MQPWLPALVPVSLGVQPLEPGIQLLAAGAEAEPAPTYLMDVIEEVGRQPCRDHRGRLKLHLVASCIRPIFLGLSLDRPACCISLAAVTNFATSCADPAF